MAHTLSTHGFSTPFTAYLLVSNNDPKVQYFTQAFSQLSGYHSSSSHIAIPVPENGNFPLELQRISPSTTYSIYFVKQPNSPILTNNGWVEGLLHELRTSSLIFDLGSYIISNQLQTTPQLVHRLLEASHRQRVSTLIASDFVQLISSPPKISPVSLMSIFMKSYTQLPDSTQINFRIFNNPINPTIWGNTSYLSRFFSTLLYWIPYQVTLDVEIVNPFSIKVSIFIPSDHYLSSIKGFILLSNYLDCVVSYFNGRHWMTQQSIIIFFPMLSDSNFGIHKSSNQSSSCT